MDAEKLNPLVDLQADDKLFVGRYVEGLFTPQQLALGVLLDLLTKNIPVVAITTSAISLGADTQAVVDTVYTVITSMDPSATLYLPSGFGPMHRTIGNRTGSDITISAQGTNTIEGQSRATIPVGTSATFFFVAGENTWYAK